MAASGQATLAGHKPPRRLATRWLAMPGRRDADWPRWPAAGRPQATTPAGRAEPPRRRLAVPAPEPRSGHRQKRGGEEGGGGRGEPTMGTETTRAALRGGGVSVWLRAMWWREGALGDVGVRHEGRLGKTALPSGPHGRWRRRMGRSRARVCGGGGSCGVGWAARALGAGAAR
jgi:hypothetical protein